METSTQNNCSYLFDTKRWEWVCSNCGRGTTYPDEIETYCTRCGYEVIEKTPILETRHEVAKKTSMLEAK